ncbi:S9 family peptidase [Paenarthrobacter sp. CCNWLY172]|uniref:S9 family peptidase n=1 Tax=unclassified Paenarthrobacter TaxID=2634190 RepID=UPI0030768D07
MKPEQLPLLNSVSAPAIHPDGTKAVVSVTRPDFDADSYVGQLWTVPLDTTKHPRRITRGFRDSSPAFSPDGLVLAFLRSDPDGKPQIFVVEAAGGEPQRITDQHTGVAGFVWAPDSHRIAFLARVPEQGRYGTVEGVTSGGEDARLLTANQYRMNGVGYTSDQRQQVFVVEVPELGGEPAVAPRGRAAHERPAPAAPGIPAARQLTFGDSDHESPCFSADGAHLYFVAALHEGHDDDLVTSVYRVEAGGSQPSVVEPSNAGLQTVTGVRASLDGRWLFYTAQDLGTTGKDFVARNGVLYVMPVDGGEATALTDEEHLDVSGPLEPSGPASVLVLNTALGSVELLDVPADGEIMPLVHGARVVIGATVAANGEIAVSLADASTMGDVASLVRGELRLLTDFSAALRNNSRVSEPLHLDTESSDGHPVHGWLVLPDGPGPHPVLLSIHGGPFAQYTGAYFDEAQVYAAAGYAVVMCNPRGSAGYGQTHGRAIKGRMGTLDMQDVLAFLDAALAAHSAVLDKDRVGIMGGSYGGYLTAWTIAHDHRFKAAIVERGFLDPVSFAGSSDIGWFFGGEYTGGTPEQMTAQSPMAVVGAVQTPTLVVHSENDLRCPIEQGQRYYSHLKAQGVETALLVFPGEDHELSRSGTPHHRKQRFDHILGWWARHLPTASNQAEGQVH